MKWAVLSAALFAGQLAAATLEGYASLTADTLMPGPDSGHFIETGEATALPFNGQPVQGFSAIIANDDGTYLVLADNGFGNRLNSPDFLLRIYCIEVEFRTASGGSGTIGINGYINLSDPNHLSPYQAIWDGTVPTGIKLIPPPHPTIAANRILTGADIDPESLQRAMDGTLWIGDEFGPFILHTNSQGELVDPPYRLAGLVSESRPLRVTRPEGQPVATEKATLPSSKGFEGMAITPSGQMLHPMLEGSLFGQPGQLNIYSFDLETRSYKNNSALEPSFRYRLEPEATAIGAFKLFSETAGLVLERDSGEAGTALHKKVFRVDFSRVDEQGFLLKKEVADLMKISDPLDLNHDGQDLYTFPFNTPEGLLVVDNNTIGIINDNNYPFGRGRGEQFGPEATEFILIAIEDLW